MSTSIHGQRDPIAIRRRIAERAAELFAEIDRELDVYDTRTADAARGFVDLLIERSPLRAAAAAAGT